MGLDAFIDLLRKNLSNTDFNRMMTFTASMEPERRSAMMQFLAERETHAPAVAAQWLPTLNCRASTAVQPVQLSSFRGRKPVALIFGSYT